MSNDKRFFLSFCFPSTYIFSYILVHLLNSLHRLLNIIYAQSFLHLHECQCKVLITHVIDLFFTISMVNDFLPYRLWLHRFQCNFAVSQTFGVVIINHNSAPILYLSFSSFEFKISANFSSVASGLVATLTLLLKMPLRNLSNAGRIDT
jgi:hypothetical protein